MFNPRKTDNYPGNPGTFGVILAALIALSIVTQILTTGAAPKVILVVAAMFGLWWMYNALWKKDSKKPEMAKYRAAVEQQNKKRKAQENAAQEKGKVIYLDAHKRSR